jgi:segregation and condensation protein B
MARRPKSTAPLDTELADLPPALRWRTWMGRVEAVIFAAPAPVTRATLARVVGKTCSVELLIADIRAELAGRPYELVAVAGGWQHRTKPTFADAIRAATGLGETVRPLAPAELLVLMAIAYYQPITRGELSAFFGKEVSRDTIASLRARGFVAAGPRAPQPGAPATLVTTQGFLAHFGFASLRDLPDMEALADAGLLGKDKLLAGEFPSGLVSADEDAEADAIEAEDAADGP